MTLSRSESIIVSGLKQPKNARMVSLKLEATDFLLTDAFLAHMFTCFYEYFYIKKQQRHK